MRFWFYVLGLSTLFTGTAMIITVNGENSPGIAAQAATQPSAPASAYQFDFTAIDGKPMPLAQYRGKVLLVVNTASFCGFTPQYEGLQKLQTQYADRGFTVIGVPSGDFRDQEYDDNNKIREFCETKFGITFPLTEKSVVTGERAHPFYRWASASLSTDNAPKWNFHKFLVGRDGRLIAGFATKVAPDDPRLTRAIEQALTTEESTT